MRGRIVDEIDHRMQRAVNPDPAGCEHDCMDARLEREIDDARKAGAAADPEVADLLCVHVRQRFEIVDRGAEIVLPLQRQAALVVHASAVTRGWGE
jgi:hypothetical protein